MISPQCLRTTPFSQDEGCHIRLCQGVVCHPFIRPASKGRHPFPLCARRLGISGPWLHPVHSTSSTHRLGWIHLLGLSLPSRPMVNRNALNATAMHSFVCPLGLLPSRTGPNTLPDTVALENRFPKTLAHSSTQQNSQSFFYTGSSEKNNLTISFAPLNCSFYCLFVCFLFSFFCVELFSHGDYVLCLIWKIIQ